MDKQFKFVFFGTPRFAEIILGRLMDAGMPPVALVANPDRPAGRKKILTAPLTKQRVEKSAAQIEVLQPEQLDEELVRKLKALEPDLFVVAAYAKIIPREIVNIPRLGTVGVHPSLLPEYRGASPIQSVIMHGDKETGVSIYQIDEKMDHGPVFAQEQCDAGAGLIGYLELEERLANLGADLLLKTLPEIADGKLKSKPQDESKATYTKKIQTEDAFINDVDLAAAEAGNVPKAQEIIQKINALNPEPGAWTIRNGKRIKLLAARIANGRLVLTETRS